MASSYNLRKRLKHDLVKTRVTNKLTGGWENAYIVPGGTRECHPDFIATPLGGDSPYNFLLCSRKMEKLANVNIVKKVNKNGITREYTLYNTDRRPYEPERQFFNTNHFELKAKDYMREPIKFRGIGTEKLDTDKTEFEDADDFYINTDEYDDYHAIHPKLRNGVSMN